MKDKGRRKLIAYNMKKVAIEEAVHKKFDLDISENILKNLSYPTDTVFIDRPTDQRYYSNESEDDELWVWAGFLPPGAFTFQVDDPLNGTFHQTVLVSPRLTDLNYNKFVPMTGDDQESGSSAFQNFVHDD